jgi:hypothetical protein
MNTHIEQPPLQPSANAYLHAEYWNGHMFGATPARTLTAEEVSNTGWHYADAYLEMFLDGNGSHVALQTLRDGAVWDATEQEPGSIVMMHHERLTTLKRFDRSKIPELAAPHPVPERQIYVTKLSYTHEGIVSYKREPAYGIVVAAKNNKPNRMFRVPVDGLEKNRHGNVEVQSHETMRIATRLVVGETAQVYGEHARAESLERVNLIEVIGAGATRRRKRERLSWLPGLRRPVTEM